MSSNLFVVFAVLCGLVCGAGVMWTQHRSAPVPQVSFATTLEDDDDGDDDDDVDDSDDDDSDDATQDPEG